MVSRFLHCTGVTHCDHCELYSPYTQARGGRLSKPIAFSYFTGLERNDRRVDTDYRTRRTTEQRALPMQCDVCR
ncbi:hypothetical protein DTO164E3_3252 [Paecilomyces variotii]|nr:hypothetical protein DTO032I3_8983 [Paecilomyces variotii]KAJ9201814.1 hypothetical protein DTO164E3_3252 [Paecilomyces variotii]KAJ9250486.1 hypothetical protein DTO207G8_6059 [Paecilomyces variotii]KAJ9274661.1 hypothetical protein DTO021D3_8466 [Paecilomyces variotii]KAJ9307458.1 hypothetical protein DTO217A2_3140 [Paecilomyces variotii]